jgi:hypothetical protein
MVEQRLPATGSLTATETGSDTAAITGTVRVAGSIAATETGADTAALTGAVRVAGALAAPETGGDTAALVGAVRIAGALGSTESGADVCAIVGAVTGAVVAAPVTGAGSGKLRRHLNPNFHANEVPQFAPFTPRPIAPKPVRAVLAAREEPGGDTASAAGRVRISGRMAAREAEGLDTATGRGIVRHSRAAIARGVLRVLFKFDDAA